MRSAIKRVTEFKYLGVIFDELLSWKEHVKEIVSKAGRRVDLLGRVKFAVISPHIVQMPFFFKSMIRSTLEYYGGVWGSCEEVNSGTLETLQKCVGRIVIKTSSSDTATKALEWPSLRSRRDEHIQKLVRKCVHGRCPQYFKNYFVFNKDICARSTRQSNLLHLPAIRTEVAKRSFYYHGSMVFKSDCQGEGVSKEICGTVRLPV